MQGLQEANLPFKNKDWVHKKTNQRSKSKKRGPQGKKGAPKGNQENNLCKQFKANRSWLDGCRGKS